MVTLKIVKYVVMGVTEKGSTVRLQEIPSDEIKTQMAEWCYENGYLDPHGTTQTMPNPDGEGIIKQAKELSDVLAEFLYSVEMN